LLTLKPCEYLACGMPALNQPPPPPHPPTPSLVRVKENKAKTYL